MEYLVRLDSAESANQIRAEFGRLVRGVRAGRPLPDFVKGVYLSNLTTLSTKVRVDIMRAICDRIRTSQENRTRHVFCDAFLSHPLIRIRPSSVKGGQDDKGFRGLNYNFVESVETFGDRLDEKDLYWAYRRVGKSFKGQLEGLFLVLNELGRANNINQTPPERKGGKAGSTDTGAASGHKSGGLKRKSDEPGPSAKKATSS
jgi:hypothetical protein